MYNYYLSLRMYIGFFKKNVYVEKLDLSDNGIEEIGASLISSMLGDNCYITQLVSKCNDL